MKGVGNALFESSDYIQVPRIQILAELMYTV